MSKDPVKGNSVENFILHNLSITCMISEDMHCFMENINLLPKEQKGCRRKSRGMKDQLLIDKRILKDYRKEMIDYRKAYDFVPNSWILGCIDMLGSTD